MKIVLWVPWLTVYNHFDTIFKTYAEWGIPAMKIDFMDHADQWMVNFYKKVTAEAAKYHIVLDWHGAFTPAGLEYEYPNLLSYEGILGLEQMERCRPENTVWLPFIRNAVGAADFTPGGMYNLQPDRYRAIRPNSGAPGTRAFNMALYVVLESGVQMLCDNPTRYYENEDCARYIASVPTTWDETRALEAKAGEYVIVAKRKGSKWFIGGITNGTERDFSLKLDFLSPGRHRMTAFQRRLPGHALQQGRKECRQLGNRRHPHGPQRRLGGSHRVGPRKPVQGASSIRAASSIGKEATRAICRTSALKRRRS